MKKLIILIVVFFIIVIGLIVWLLPSRPTDSSSITDPSVNGDQQDADLSEIPPPPPPPIGDITQRIQKGIITSIADGTITFEAKGSEYKAFVSDSTEYRELISEGESENGSPIGRIEEVTLAEFIVGDEITLFSENDILGKSEFSVILVEKGSY